MDLKMKNKKALSLGTFKRKATEFDYKGMMTSKFLIQKSGSIVRVSPTGHRTVAKSVTPRTFYLKTVGNARYSHIEGNFEAIWNYFWQEPVYATRDNFSLNKSFKTFINNILHKKTTSA